MDDIRAKQNVVFSVLALLFNMLSFTLIITSPSLRTLSKFHIITSMSIANIIACLAFFPADTQSALHEDSYSDGKFRIILHCIHMYCTPSVLSVSLVCLGIDYMVNKVYNIRLHKKIITSIISITVPWGFGLLSLLPFAYFQHPANTSNLLYDYNSVSDMYSNTTVKLETLNTQQYKINAEALLTFMTSLWGILPLILAFLTSTLCILRRQIHKPFSLNITQGSSTSAYNRDENIREISIVDTVVSTVVFIVLTVPFYVESFSSINCSSSEDCLVKGGQSRRSELARWSATFTLPALWMMDAEFREAFVLLCGKIGVASCAVQY